MTRPPSPRRWRLLGPAALCASVALCAGAAHAQSAPPLAIPVGGPPGDDPTAFSFGSWQIHGGLDAVAQYSNNYLLTTPPILSGVSAGLTPHVSAISSNGIHTTALDLSYTNLRYASFDANDGEASVTQTYSPLRGLTISLNGD